MNRIRINSDVVYKIDIGCKNKTKDGCLGIDIIDFGQDIVWNINNGIPFPDNSVEYIYMSHFLEHIEDRYIASLFTDIYRVSIDGTIIDIKIPHRENIESYYLGQVSWWDEARIKGIVQGFGNNFGILDLHKKGIELISKLKVNK